MWHSPLLLEPVLPPDDDPGIRNILEGLCRAAQAEGCELRLQLLPDGPEVTYRSGSIVDEPPLLIHMEPGPRVRGTCAVSRPASRVLGTPSALDGVRPLLEGAILALVERSNTLQQLDLLAEVVGSGHAATLLIDSRGGILYANPEGEALLSRHTEQPMAALAGGQESGPLLHLVLAELTAQGEAGDRLRRQPVSLDQGPPWELETVALSSGEDRGFFLVVFHPPGLPNGDELRRRLKPCGITRREAQILSLVLQGKKALEIAGELHITEYTVRDHLKHAYRKLGIKAGSQLLARLGLP